jgi:glycogen operon protein
MIDGRGVPEIQWHGIKINQPLWDDPDAKVLAFTLAGVECDEPDLHVVMNMSDQPVKIELPVISGRRWCLAVDTSLTAPQDIVPIAGQKTMVENFYSVNGRTVVVFENRE